MIGDTTDGASSEVYDDNFDATTISFPVEDDDFTYLFSFDDMSHFPSSPPPLSLPPEVTPLDTPKRKTNKKENKMEPDEWKLAVTNAIGFIQRMNGPITNRDITIDDFTTEPKQANRFTVGKDVKRFCVMFPWFHLSGPHRFRQSLALDLRQGTTITRVIEAMNALFRKDYRQGDSLEKLERYYHQMEIPISSHCLTAIVEVYVIIFPDPRRENFRGGEKRAFHQNVQAPPELMLRDTFSSSVKSAPVIATTAPAPESPFPFENSGPEIVLDDTDPPHKRLRRLTNEEAIERNHEMIRYYQALLRTTPPGANSSDQIYLNLIQNLEKGNEALMIDLLMLDDEEGKSWSL
jgi:hypothetical protein